MPRVLVVDTSQAAAEALATRISKHGGNREGAEVLLLRPWEPLHSLRFMSSDFDLIAVGSVPGHINQATLARALQRHFHTSAIIFSPLSDRARGYDGGQKIQHAYYVSNWVCWENAVAGLLGQASTGP